MCLQQGVEIAVLLVNKLSVVIGEIQGQDGVVEESNVLRVYSEHLEKLHGKQ